MSEGLSNSTRGQAGIDLWVPVILAAILCLVIILYFGVMALV